MAVHGYPQIANPEEVGGDNQADVRGCPNRHNAKV